MLYLKRRGEIAKGDGYAGISIEGDRLLSQDEFDAFKNTRCAINHRIVGLKYKI